MGETVIEEGLQESHGDENAISNGTCRSSIAPSVDFQGSVVPSARARYITGLKAHVQFSKSMPCVKVRR